jgi:hypothetical protein
MKYAIIENGIVTNVAIAYEALESNWVQSDTAQKGDLYTNGQFTKPTPVVDPLAYRAQRVEEYPPIGDQLDALFHAGVFPDSMAAIIQAVKDKYPKP